jgi:enoyl-CoA hydratase
MDGKYVVTERFDEGAIVRITLNRPEARNAQNRGMLVELGAAFEEAEADDRVRAVILAGAGPLFTAGHDLGSKADVAERAPGPQQHPTFTSHGATRVGAESRMLQEWHFYFQNTLRWRNLRKITIAEVQGTVYAAGLMLMWCCDLIVAADNAKFADVVGTRLGMCGIEYFAHPWEFGPRKTKELMLTGDSIDVDEAHRLGMVSKVFPAAELPEMTLAYARRIASLPTMAALLIRSPSIRRWITWASTTGCKPASRCISSTTLTGLRCAVMASAVHVRRTVSRTGGPPGQYCPRCGMM